MANGWRFGVAGEELDEATEPAQREHAAEHQQRHARAGKAHAEIPLDTLVTKLLRQVGVDGAQSPTVGGGKRPPPASWAISANSPELTGTGTGWRTLPPPTVMVPWAVPTATV